MAIISTARSPCSTGRPFSTSALYTEVAFPRGLNAAGPAKRHNKDVRMGKHENFRNRLLQPASQPTTIHANIVLDTKFDTMFKRTSDAQ